MRNLLTELEETGLEATNNKCYPLDEWLNKAGIKTFDLLFANGLIELASTRLEYTVIQTTKSGEDYLQLFSGRTAVSFDMVEETFENTGEFMNSPLYNILPCGVCNAIVEILDSK